MDIDSQLILGVIPAIAFFVLIPLAGAFAVRKRWRRFRRAVLRASELPRLDYTIAHGSGSEAGECGDVSFFGRLEGIQGDRGIWLGSKGISVALDLSRVPVFLLPQQPVTEGAPPDATPRVVYWREMNALVEGTRFFVAGTVQREESGTLTLGRPSTKDVPLVIMYDGSDRDVLTRAMWTGRQRNEYWNHLTPISLIVGFLAELLWVVRVFDESRLYALIGIIAAVLPVLPLIPPGILGFYVYRRLWQRGRRIRAHRDVKLLEATDAGEDRLTLRYTVAASLRELIASAAFLLGLAANVYIGALILALLLR